MPTTPRSPRKRRVTRTELVRRMAQALEDVHATAARALGDDVELAERLLAAGRRSRAP